MKHILFVDDDPHVLRAIRRGLRTQQDGWDLQFADGADTALELMSNIDFDVIVSDMAMPQTTGIDLLRQVRNQYPDTIRIMMSGTAEAETVMKAVPVAHRFVSKPWEVQSLVSVIQRAFDLRNLLDEGPVRDAVGGVTSLPTLPSVYQQVCQVLETPGTQLTDVAAAVQRDPAVVARLLHIVNSAFFAPPRQLTNVTETIRYLGTSLLKSLVLSAAVFNAFHRATQIRGFSLEDLQSRSLLTAKLAARLATTDPDSALTAGLLHDVGQLVLADRMGDDWGAVYREAKKVQRPLADVEFEHLGTTHAAVGAYLLGMWGLPQELVEAVADHHNAPDRTRNSQLATVVNVSCSLAGSSEAVQAPVDPEFLERLGQPDIEACMSLKRRLGQTID